MLETSTYGALIPALSTHVSPCSAQADLHVRRSRSADQNAKIWREQNVGVLRAGGKLASTAPCSMAIINPGVSPAGTLESAASFTLVDAQTRSTPRCGRITCVVSVPEVIVPLAGNDRLPLGNLKRPGNLGRLVRVLAVQRHNRNRAGLIFAGLIRYRGSAPSEGLGRTMRNWPPESPPTKEIPPDRPAASVSRVAYRSRIRSNIAFTFSENYGSSGAHPRSIRSRGEIARPQSANCGGAIP
jgi:hypothetical protein